MGAVVAYLELTQRGKLPMLRPPVKEAAGGSMQIDAATRRNLEIAQALSGGREGSLIAAIDRTVTAAGARLLERRVSAPSRDLVEIHGRLEAVRALVADSALRDGLLDMLRRVPDMDRALSRLALDRGGPRDLGAIRAGLVQAVAAAGRLAGADVPERLKGAALTGHGTLIGRLEKALVEEPPLLTRDGGFIAAGVDADLDQARELRDHGRGVIGRMQGEYAALAGVPGLRIKHNNVLGYFIETTDTHAARMLSAPLNETFIHRQTTANQVRFTTVALSEIETRILNAGNLSLEIEKRLFETLRGEVLAEAGRLSDAARALAEIDLTAALADLAVGDDWCEPVVDDSRAFQVTRRAASGGGTRADTAGRGVHRQ